MSELCINLSWQPKHRADRYDDGIRPDPIPHPTRTETYESTKLFHNRAIPMTGLQCQRCGIPDAKEKYCVDCGETVKREYDLIRLRKFNAKNKKNR